VDALGIGDGKSNRNQKFSCPKGLYSVCKGTAFLLEEVGFNISPIVVIAGAALFVFTCIGCCCCCCCCCICSQKRRGEVVRRSKKDPLVRSKRRRTPEHQYRLQSIRHSSAELPPPPSGKSRRRRRTPERKSIRPSSTELPQRLPSTFYTIDSIDYQ